VSDDDFDDDGGTRFCPGACLDTSCARQMGRRLVVVRDMVVGDIGN
jgi:hypothetical protein